MKDIIINIIKYLIKNFEITRFDIFQDIEKPKEEVVNSTIIKKNKLGLSKWGLSSQLEDKAQQFLILCKDSGYNIKITQGRRTQVEQDALYAQGRTTTGKIVTNTRNSIHLTGNAFDIAFEGKDPYPENFDWSILGKIGKSVGLKWGGDFKSFKDNLHFEI